MSINIEEKWKPVVLEDGTPTHFIISNRGRVKNIVTNRLVRCHATSIGYLEFYVKKGLTLAVHREVARAFINPNIKGKEVHHKNHTRYDNRVENLEVLDKSTHARLGAIETGRSLHPDTVREICKCIIYEDLSVNEIAKRFGVEPYVIYNISNGITYTEITKEFPELMALKKDRNKKPWFWDSLIKMKKDGARNKDILNYLKTECHLTDELAYYHNSQLKKFMDREKRGKQGKLNYKMYNDTIDAMISNGAGFHELAKWFEANTDLDRIQYSNYIHRRLKAVLKELNKMYD